MKIPYQFQKYQNINNSFIFTLTLLFTTIFSNTLWASCNGSEEDTWSTSSTSSFSKNNETAKDDSQDYYTITVHTYGDMSITVKDDDNDNNDNLVVNFYKDANCNDSIWSDSTTSRNETGNLTSTETLRTGTYVLHIAGSSGDNTRYDISLNFTSKVEPISPPIMGDIPNTVATIDTSFSLDISSYVTLTNDDPVLEYTLTGTLPNGLTFYPSTGIISGTPDTLTSSSFLSITATDNDGVSNRDSFTLSVSELNIEDFDLRDFEERHQANLFGDVKVIGNTVLCILDSDDKCVEPTNEDSNADTKLEKPLLSYSTLTIPTDANITYARIYWQGRKEATTNDLEWDATSKTAASKIKIRKGDSGNFTELPADIKDFYSTESNNYVRVYSASADAKSIVNGSGKYYIDTASFYTNEGETNDNNPGDGLGAYGAWTLVVIYNDPNETTARNITIFDGYKKVASGENVDIDVSGFLTPSSDPVDSKTYVFAAEGDKYLKVNGVLKTGDSIQMAGLTKNTAYKTLGTFDSRVDVDGVRYPNLTNNNGIDIHKYDTGTSSGAKNIITTDEVGAKFRFTSDQDTYFPSLIVFSTELYLPKMCYDYSIKQDGRYFAVDRNTYPEAQIDQQISSSDIEIGIYLRNEESDLEAEGIAIRTDLNATQFNHVGQIYTSNTNGSSLIGRGTPNSAGSLCEYDKNGDNSVSNAGCTDGHDIRKGNGSLGEFDYVYTKFIIQPQNVNGIVDINESLGLSIRYYVTANGSKIAYPDYVLGGLNVPICPPTTSYQPEWGQFNVVRNGQTNNNITNNLYTQVSRKPFGAAVVFDSDPSSGTNEAPTSDINTTVLVEMIDLDAFGDINASCANPDASISEPIFLQLGFDSGNSQANIPIQTSDYYNFAVKNATFRVWYFDDANQTLIQNWTATTSDTTRKVLTSISGLYDSNIHTVCTSSCATSTSSTCFECIKINYAKPLCARDNFSVRPESYSLNVFDVNQSLPEYDIDNDATNLKNTTKINLSTATGYAAGTITPTLRMNLATGYDYRFDINSTGNDSIALTPGYTRVFNGGSEYNATLYWDPQTTKTGCNDTENRDIAFYFKDGKVENEERLHDNVGEYRLNLIDTTWTAVDYLYTSHHTPANGFDISTTDCAVNSDATSGSLNGCFITTNHGTDGVGNVYRDHALRFNPYKFNVTNTTRLGLNNSLLPTTYEPFVYMADINNTNDENMSVQFNAEISARSYDNSKVSNFVKGCYAEPLDINITHSNVQNTELITDYILYDYDSTGKSISSNKITSYIDRNVSQDINISTTSTFFQKDMNGSLQTRTLVNLFKDLNTTANPERIKFFTYKVKDVDIDHTFWADLKANQFAEGNVSLEDQNNSISFFYGRTASKRVQTVCDVANANCDADDVFIYYEVFCHKITSGNTCSNSLLPKDINGNPLQRVDARWYINLDHDITRDGDLNQSVDSLNSTFITFPNGITHNTTNYYSDSVHRYQVGNGLPYTAIMRDTVPSWLIYNENNATATTNSHTVTFRGRTEWSGEHEADSTTKTDRIIRTNRRTMW